MRVVALKAWSNGSISMEERQIAELPDALATSLIAQGIVAPTALPEITDADDGKVLTANNGVWGASDRQIPITYSDLVALRNAGNLVKGATYRMTDFVTKINGTYDLSAIGASGYVHVAKSAEHPFDLILYAVDESHLSEIARAALHSGDTYFANANIDAWDIRYCIDNDTTRFAWADTTNGKGVIYWMRDEWDNECGYDFKNVLMVRYALSLVDGAEDTGLKFDLFEQPNRYGDPNHLFTALQSYMESGTYVNPYPHTYDFAVGANILGTVQMPTIDATYLETFQADLYYTFDFFDGYLAHHDASLNANSKIPCRNNKIDATSDPVMSVMAGNQTVLGLGCNCWETNAVFVAEMSGTSIDNIQNNELGNGCCFNTFGNYCYSNTFGNYCDSNTFGNNCYSNTFGNNCYSNTFGNSCYSNTFGNYCYSNTFGNYCDYNTFGNDCYYNTFGNNCYSNTFGNYCYSNTFGNYCYYNTFGNNCYSNTFGNYCYSNTFGNNCYYNTFGNNCYSNTFGNTDNNNELQGYINHCKFGEECLYVTFDGGANGTPINYYTFMDAVKGTDISPVTVTGQSRNYETYVGYNSSGVLKTWCPADLAT